MSSYQTPHAAPDDGRPKDLFLAAAPRTRRIRELGEQVAGTNAPVLITGESGVGKEVLARFIHARSHRARRAFIKINCAAVPHELLESELFGHERGAFTGAHQRKEGKFEAAQGGTILLDEIGDMSLALQAKLLHVLEDSTYCRVGGNRAVPMDARILATTNKPLEAAIGAGEFRKDLYFRLKVIQIQIPPLRERQADIPVLCEHFVRTYADRYDRGVTRTPDRLMEAFMSYGWPGNVRELKHVIQRYLILPDEEMVLADLASARGPEELDGRSALAARGLETDGAEPERAVATALTGTNGNGHSGYGHSGNGLSGNGLSGNGLSGNGHSGGDKVLFHPGAGASGRGEKIQLKTIAAQAAEEAEKRVVLQVLQECRWNRKKAASRMDICYKTLLNKLDRWELDGHGAAVAPPPFFEQPRRQTL